MQNKVRRLIDLLRCAMYPNIYHDGIVRPEFVPSLVTGKLQEAAALLYEMCSSIMTATCHQENKGGVECDGCREKAELVTCRFMESLCDIAEVLNTDIVAAYEGDPAARSAEEILLAYPAFEALSIFRLAHRLYELGVPLIPRMMTEQAHSRTGIDIHPGATIGRYFFIDHGTGVVIGETCIIGERVKLYQGVTLGAKSFALDEEGKPVKGVHRHPRVGNNVVIYAGATILGGDTVIGDDSIIGGSVWLTKSVPAGSRIYNK
ncbi:MAG: serine acetyltransferase [Clostridia bacterium]|nr:serine acetyltransferase [Clostridia bacterium]